jgi:hypothetical protein
MLLHKRNSNPSPEGLLTEILHYLALWGPRITTAIAAAGGAPSTTLTDFQSDLAFTLDWLEERRYNADQIPFNPDPFTWDDADLPIEGQINE